MDMKEYIDQHRWYASITVRSSDHVRRYTNGNPAHTACAKSNSKFKRETFTVHQITTVPFPCSEYNIDRRPRRLCNH